MEKFYNPTNKIKFIEWLLHTSLSNKWTIVLEYSNHEADRILKNSVVETTLPDNEINYDQSWNRIAFDDFLFTNVFADQILTLTHTFKVYDKREKIFEIADDFHEECFSSSVVFFDKYEKQLFDKKLVDKILK